MDSKQSSDTAWPEGEATAKEAIFHHETHGKTIYDNHYTDLDYERDMAQVQAGFEPVADGVILIGITA